MSFLAMIPEPRMMGSVREIATYARIKEQSPEPQNNAYGVTEQRSYRNRCATLGTDRLENAFKAFSLSKFRGFTCSP